MNKWYISILIITSFMSIFFYFKEEVKAITENHKETISSYIFLTKWGCKGNRIGQFNNPVDISSDINGNIYIADALNYRVQKFDKNGNFLLEWGSKGFENEQFRTIDSLTVSLKNLVYVADNMGNSLHLFNSEGQFIKKWGGEELYLENKFFNGPIAVETDQLENIYVVNLFDNYMVQIISHSNLITKWHPEVNSGEQFNTLKNIAITDIAIDSNQNIYIVDGYNHCIQKFNSNLQFLIKWGTKGFGDGQFNTPTGIDIDEEDNIYIADFQNHRIQKFNANGEFITKFGSQGTEDGQFSFPKSITVFKGRIYIIDTGNNRVQVFEKKS